MFDLDALTTDLGALLDYPTARKGNGAQPVLYTVRSDETGFLVGVKLSKNAGSDTTLTIFSGAGPRDGSGKRLRPNQTYGEIPKGTWFIVRYGKQKTPAETFKVLKQQQILGALGFDIYRAATQNPLWLSLFRDDGDRIDDLTREGPVVRKGVRLHFGRVSDGCFTFSKLSGYLKVLALLRKTLPKFYDMDGNPVPKGTPNALEVYGKLVVSG
ncbi:hypothetical protein HKX54_08105 [Sulfitobacter sp. M57]|uniref:hypothetical protein n=1 Tax=unclassified Sulfitobacter TaxID=196795 RepID=UPI0023E0B8B4|nr:MULTISPECIES: hypothetical protein [unclassified Sulfitobacter]MDF3414414.1 hypothetical protein [Sulfitobacter sp. KE5]MDF3421895.1 hypothetical protein [Sulfitobacter sp. KE43]MDF3432960.1 hypothetical protein [Sulfitobacter sp. KE42]MDF3458600.1 hypothetical protein [Sulfitobacter sp. S74]MDF3462500.1 hypothetical protein [Sulfitobacter sp. Ks18]